MAFLAAPGVAQGFAQAAPYAMPVAKQGISALTIIIGLIIGFFLIIIIAAIIAGSKKKSGRKSK